MGLCGERAEHQPVPGSSSGKKAERSLFFRLNNTGKTTEVSNTEKNIKDALLPHEGLGGFPVEWFWTFLEEVEDKVGTLLEPSVPTRLTNTEKKHLERLLTDARQAISNLKPSGEDQGKVRLTYESFRENMHSVLTLGAVGVARQAAKKILAPPIRRDDGRRGVAKSLRSRREREKAHPGVIHAEELAKEIRNEHRDWSQDRVASEIEGRWKLKKPNEAPTHETLIKRIRKMEKAGVLPRRQAAQPAGSRKRPNRFAG